MIRRMRLRLGRISIERPGADDEKVDREKKNSDFKKIVDTVDIDASYLDFDTLNQVLNL